MGLEQRTLRKRICICIPLFAAGLVIIFGLPFETMWSYFAWMNQTLAMVTLWMITAFLNRHGRNRWVGLIPALVMTYVCSSYVFVSPLMCGMRDRAATSEVISRMFRAESTGVERMALASCETTSSSE